MKFELNDDQVTQLMDWLGEQQHKAVAKQRAEWVAPPEYVTECWADGYAYTGAIGGDYEVCFTLTSLGVTAVGRHLVTREEINLTDFSHW